MRAMTRFRCDECGHISESKEDHWYHVKKDHPHKVALYTIVDEEGRPV